MKNTYGYQKGGKKKPKGRNSRSSASNWAAQALASPLFRQRAVPSLRRKSEGERRGSQYWVNQYA